MKSIPVTIEYIADNLLAKKIGLLSGDTLLAINDQQVDVRNIGRILNENIDKDITVAFMRDHRKLLVKGYCPKDACVLGIAYYEGAIDVKPIKFPLGKAMIAAVQEIRAQTTMTFNVL